MTNVAFLGTGIMGLPMAGHILAAGFPLTVWNRTAEKCMPLVAQGARLASGPADAVTGADIVILMLHDGPACDEILFGANGCLGSLKAGAVVVVMSSIPVDTSRQQADRLADHGVGYVDAPVSGGERGAREATLTIMAGGSEADLETIRPVMEAMGRLTRVGPVGCGQLSKLANQSIVGITIEAIAEAFMLARAGGVDLAALKTALTGGFADSTIFQQHGQRMIDGAYTPGGTCTVQLKDLRTAMAQAAGLGLALPLLAETSAIYDRICKTDLAAKDHSAAFAFLERQHEDAATL